MYAEILSIEWQARLRVFCDYLKSVMFRNIENIHQGLVKDIADLSTCCNRVLRCSRQANLLGVICCPKGCNYLSSPGLLVTQQSKFSSDIVIGNYGLRLRQALRSSSCFAADN